MGRVDDLTVFLRARLDEDEARHKDAYMDGRLVEYSARVLREVEAKRAIVRRYERGAGGELPEWQAGRELIVAGLAILLGVLRDLAAVYSDHPDYRQKWKP